MEGAFATARASGVSVENMTLSSGVSSASLTGNVKMMLPDPVVENDSLVAMMGPGGTISEIITDTIDPAFNPNDIQTYIVQEGDTLASIAQDYNLSINTLRWGNDMAKGTNVKPGQKLLIMPFNGIAYTVRRGDTLAAIAKKYKADVADIKDFNGFDSDSDLVVGTKIAIPGGEIVETVKKPVGVKGVVKGAVKFLGGGEIRNGYMRPWVTGTITQSCHDKNAIDVGMPVGSGLRAAKAGTVVIAANGWNGGYGNYVVISHGNGINTLYGHMSRVDVVVGQQVTQGQSIGLSGNSGKSTGPHLHWKIVGASACALW